MLLRFLKIFAFLYLTSSLLPTAQAGELDCFKKLPAFGTFTQDYDLSYNSTLVRSNNAYANRYFEGSVRGGYNVSAQDNLYVFFRGQKLLEDRAQEYVANQWDLGYRYSFCAGSKFTFRVSLFYGAPVAQELRKYDHAHGQSSSRQSVSWKTGLEGLSIGLNSTLRRHYFRYTDNSGGRYLKKWGFEPGANVTYSHGDFTFTFDFVDFMGWDFQGEQMRSQYYHEESISYSIDDKWSVALLHKSDGLLANYAGTGADISLYDRDRSELALGVNYSN